MNSKQKYEYKTKYLVQIVNEMKNAENNLNRDDSKLIQLLENDLKALENGVSLQKMHIEKKKFKKRLYKFDFKNKKLVASTRQFGKKEKICDCLF
jgi:hypothetical protein